MEQMETAQRLAGCSFGVNGVPFWGKLRASLTQNEGRTPLSRRDLTVAANPRSIVVSPARIPRWPNRAPCILGATLYSSGATVTGRPSGTSVISSWQVSRDRTGS